MSEAAPNVSDRSTPPHLWAVGVVSLLWHAGGVLDYLAVQLELEFYVSNFTEEQAAYYFNFPWWQTSFYAFGVWGAFAGSVFLLLRRSWAIAAFAVSLFGLAGSTAYTITHRGYETMGDITFSAVIWVLTFAFMLYALWMTRRGVLR